MNKKRVILSLSLFFGWVMSFAYEGPVMYAMAADKGLDEHMLNILSVIFHAGGLFSAQFITKNSIQAKRNIIGFSTVSFIISLSIPMIHVKLWAYVLPLISFLMGLVVASSAQLIKDFTLRSRREIVASDVLILGNIVLIIGHILSNNFKSMMAFSIIEVLFLIGILLMVRCELPEVLSDPEKKVVSIKSFWIFFLFIFILSINSGIMFRVIYPYFDEFSLLTSLYTNVPYVLAIFLLARLIKINKFQFFYMGLAFWAITFVLFSVIGQSAFGFLVICTFMLAACGIFDLFWWGTIFENLEIVENPTALMGNALSLNVFGVWVGVLMGAYISKIGQVQGVSIVGLFVVVVSAMIVLPLNIKLSRFLTENNFLMSFEQVDVLKAVEHQLSTREYEVFTLLVQGLTDKDICEKLFISQNTVKTHNRNIYKKLQVTNRKDLINQYT